MVSFYKFYIFIVGPASLRDVNIFKSEQFSGETGVIPKKSTTTILLLLTWNANIFYAICPMTTILLSKFPKKNYSIL